MSDTLTHIAVGDICAKALRTFKKPLIAFLIGMLSHGVLDMVDNDYTINITNYEAFKTDRDYIGFQIAGTAIKIYDILQDDNLERKNLRLFTMLGSVTPDIIDGVYALHHRDKWNKGEMLFPFHRPHRNIYKQQNKQISMLKTSLITLISIKINF